MLSAQKQSRHQESDDSSMDEKETALAQSRMVKGAVKKEPSAVSTRVDKQQHERGQQRTSHVLGSDPNEVAFFRFLYSELQKSIRFFDRTLQEFTLRVERLQTGIQIMLKPESIAVEERWPALEKSAFKVYKDLLNLETYAIMSFCAFSKILKKHDKRTNRSTRNAFMSSMVDRASFSDTRCLQQMIHGTLKCYKQVTDRLKEQARKATLLEEERMFVNLASQLNIDLIKVADPEGGAPISSGGRVMVDAWEAWEKNRKGRLLGGTIGEPSATTTNRVDYSLVTRRRTVSRESLHQGEPERKRPKVDFSSSF